MSIWLLSLLFVAFHLSSSCFGLNCWISDEDNGLPTKEAKNCMKSDCFVVSCGGLVAHGCGDGQGACDMMRRACVDAAVNSNKIGQFVGQLRDNRCALCRGEEGDLCNTAEILPPAEGTHKCWDKGFMGAEGEAPTKVDCGLEAIGCYKINGPGGKVAKGCFVNEPAFSLLLGLMGATPEQTQLCVGNYCNA